MNEIYVIVMPRLFPGWVPRLRGSLLQLWCMYLDCRRSIRVNIMFKIRKLIIWVYWVCNQRSYQPGHHDMNAYIISTAFQLSLIIASAFIKLDNQSIFSKYILIWSCEQKHFFLHYFCFCWALTFINTMRDQNKEMWMPCQLW